MSEAPVAAVELRRIASTGLHDDVVRVEPDRWPRVLWDLRFHRLTGLAIAAWESERLAIAPELATQLLEEHRTVMAHALRVEQRLVRLAHAFDAAGIRAVVLKGAAMAHAVYPDPAMRPFGDLDLLVSTADWRGACALLVEHGYARDLPEPRPGFDERFGKAATHSDASDVQIDLHRTLVVGPFGLWLDPEELLERTGTFELGGHTVLRLDPTGLLLNALLHAGLGASTPLLLQLRDVAQAAADPRVDWDLLTGWAVRWRLAAALRHAFEATVHQLAVELPSEVHRIVSMPPPRSELRVMRAYKDRRREGGVPLATTRAIPGVRAKAAYVFGLMLPSREFLRVRDGVGSRASYASRWRAPVRWVVRRTRRLTERGAR